MAKNEEIHLRIHLLEVVPGEDSQGLLVKALECIDRGDTPRCTAPTIAQRHRQARMHSRKEFLAKGAVEYGPKEPEAVPLRSEAVSVSQKELLAAYSLHLGVLEHLQANFVTQIVIKPDVVIAYVPLDLYARIGHLGQLAEEAHVAPGHDSGVLKPEVEDIAHQIQRARSGGYGAQKVHKPLLGLLAVSYVSRTQMGVAQKVGIFH